MIEDDDIKEVEDTIKLPVEEQDPLYPIVSITVEERREWSKPWKNSLIVN